ncbi:MAG TPA: ATP-binding protein [Steroidobacteraceae bacterium]|nr:ATP-binding protein [Steroidobacteraceae bacterium]
MSASPVPASRKVKPLRDALYAALITFSTSVIGLSIIYFQARDAQLAAVRSELLQLATTGAAQVDGDLHAQIVSREQEGSVEHERALAPLVRMHRASRDLRYVYTATMREGKIYWILDSARHYRVPGNNAPADPIMTPYQGNDPDLLRAFREQTAQADQQPVVEANHTYLSAYAPIRDSKGRFAGIFAVDMVLDDLDARMASLKRASGVALFVVLVLSGVAGYVALRIRKFSATIVAKLRAARSRAEENAAAAESASRAKAVFLAMMSHEIRSPMNGMLGVADLLRTMSPDPAQKKLLDILGSSGESLLRIINDILDFSKIEAERLELRPKPFEIGDLLDELDMLLNAQARTKQVAFVIDADPRMPAAVNGDRQRLSQILLNLGTNAVKFTDRGEVRLIVRALDCAEGKVRVEFTMRDTGIGMSSEDLARLFTPFTQVAEARGHRGGTGLGLVITQKLVSLMGGEIQVTSEPGRGSSFAFTLELPVTEIVARSTTARVPHLHVGLSVLVAEDNTVNQLIIETMLKQLGHGITLVGNGREALRRLAQDSFDVVLMDCNMPEMDGFEAMRLLRAGAAGVRDMRVPVIALTANAMDGDRERCLAAGMDDYLTKPVTLASLRAAIDGVRGSREPRIAERIMSAG